MRKRLIALVTLYVFSAGTAFAIDIEGVQPAALDQPRVNVHLRREAKGKPLAGKSDVSGTVTINIQAFLDTGASGIMLSGNTAEALGVKRISANGDGKQKPVVFHDVGVGGSDSFGVSEKLFIYLAPHKSSGEPDDPAEYPVMIGPVRTQISDGGGLIEMLTGGLDVMGMPAMKGRVVVIDPKTVDKFNDTLRTGVFERGARAQIPKTDRHIKLTYVDFKRFTRIEPAGAEFPVVAANPMIGPNPLTPANAAAPAVIARYGGKSAQGTWLLDTGAAASMISTAAAAKLGVTYVEGTQGSDNPKLAGPAADKQFAISIGGVGGVKKAAGFFLDSLSVPTRENDPLVYKPAPVLVVDISVEDPATKQKVTLDGVLGMNYFVASAFVAEGGLMPDIRNMTPGPFEWIVFDEPAGVLGVKVKK